MEIIPDGRLTFCLEGKRLRGEFALVRFTGKRKDWLLLKKARYRCGHHMEIEPVLTRSRREVLRKMIAPHETY